MRQLMILRHAKSAWPDLPDPERPLADRGRRHAPRAGRWLRDTCRIPDLVVCSTARRARQTWELVENALGTSPPVAYDDRLYAADYAELLAVVGETPDQVNRLLLVGHDPSVGDLTLYLAGKADKDTLEGVRTKFPTGALAVLQLSSGWTELRESSAELTDFFTPRR